MHIYEEALHYILVTQLIKYRKNSLYTFSNACRGKTRQLGVLVKRANQEGSRVTNKRAVHIMQNHGVLHTSSFEYFQPGITHLLSCAALQGAYQQISFLFQNLGFNPLLRI